MKKRRKIKWKNVLAAILIIDIVRTFSLLAFNVMAGFTWFGLIVLALEIVGIDLLTEV